MTRAKFTTFYLPSGARFKPNVLCVYMLRNSLPALWMRGTYFGASLDALTFYLYCTSSFIH